MQSAFLKRVVDIVLSAVLLMLLSPALLAIGLAVRLQLGRPVLFRQQRPGLGGHPFTLLKFRTMNERRDSRGELLPDQDRITSLGRFLRRSSFDELPELLNVLAGEMSLVGPRPLLMRYLGHYTPRQMRRHDAKPGITGWAQVNGRNSLSWEERFELDIWYVDHWSVWLDLKILVKTIGVVMRRDGIDFPGEMITTEFMGSTQPAKGTRF